MKTTNVRSLPGAAAYIKRYWKKHWVPCTTDTKAYPSALHHFVVVEIAGKKEVFEITIRKTRQKP